YDVLGNEVKALVNEVQPSGEHTVHFNAKGLSSGIYFYTIKAGDLIQTKKMMLVK
ncbi:MAG: T9SS type A sorting domain-containing protein, partial [Bacteroidota bacterium]|nr:T9SS type A sorting domain-containing protein [Bacteroidota bacterium]